MTVYINHINSKVPDVAIEVNTTSRSKDWSRGLSPFFVGPVELYDGRVAQNVENAWQFSKVYRKIYSQQHIGPDGLPNEDYWKWAEAGWADEAFRKSG